MRSCGKTKAVQVAIDAGYDKALLTIVDSHVTTVITGFALFLFRLGRSGFRYVMPWYRDQSVYPRWSINQRKKIDAPAALKEGIHVRDLEKTINCDARSFALSGGILAFCCVPCAKSRAHLWHQESILRAGRRSKLKLINRSESTSRRALPESNGGIGRVGNSPWVNKLLIPAKQRRRPLRRRLPEQVMAVFSKSSQQQVL